MRTGSAVILLILLLGCNETQTPTGPCARVRILNAFCDSAIMEILTPESADNGIPWEDLAGNKYNSVFSTQLTCSLMRHTDLIGLELTVEFLDEPYDSKCIRCDGALLNPPSKFMYIKPIEGCRVEPQE